MTLKKNLKLLFCSFRRLRYRLRGGQVPFTTEVHKHTFIMNSNIGEWGFISPNCFIDNTEIGNYVSIGGWVQIGAMEHPVSDLSPNTLLCKDYPKTKRTIIGHDVWIAGQTIIKQGVTIGDGAVIGANSFVNTDIPPYSVAVGTPARVIKYRFSESIQEELSSSEYWLSPPKRARLIIDGIRNKIINGTNS